jgi:hypothetical protein
MTARDRGPALRQEFEDDRNARRAESDVRQRNCNMRIEKTRLVFLAQRGMSKREVSAARARALNSSRDGAAETAALAEG